MLRRAAKGFTLLELMIVVTIVAILASLAYYNYGKFAYRTRRADGRELLMRIAAAEERFYTNTNGYTNDVTSAPPIGLGLADTSEGGHYTVSVAWGASGDNTTYVATSAPTPGDIQVNDTCGSLTYDNAGNKGWSGVHPPSNGNCW